MNLPNALPIALRRAAALLVLPALCALPARAADAVQYNRDVRPILSDNCFACHGPDKNARKAKLRLDVREEAIKAEAIVPGHPEKSALVERVFSTQRGQVMPPRKSHKTLTAAQKDLLKRWIAAGAPYQAHWSFIAPVRPPLPAVKDAAWVRNPIDRFILAALEKQGLHPAPEADRRTLARRASLDLTGLPPPPQEVEAFVNDPAPDAYERYVDHLLESPHWGEHRGRYWLDAARYADTHGIHFDNYREIWSYRDWVIKAFNANMPFDRFTVEQLAGDLLPHRTLDDQVATGFNRCNITTNEGGAIPEEYAVFYTRDRTETVSQVWLGLTAGCAVCHDHKFDPMTQRDFYSMAAFFNNTTQQAMDGNIKDTPPVVTVPRPEDRPRWDALVKETAATRQQVEARRVAARANFEKWLVQAQPKQVAAAIPADGLKFHAMLDDGGAAVNVFDSGQRRKVTFDHPAAWQPGRVAAQALKVRPDNVVAVADVGDFDKEQAFSYGAWVLLPRAGLTGSVLARMDEKIGYRGWDMWVEDGRVAAHLVHSWPDDAMKVVSQTRLKPGEWNHLFVTYDGSGKAAGLRLFVNGKPQDNRVTAADQLKSTIRCGVPLKVGQRNTSARLDDLGVQDVRVYGRALTAPEVEHLATGTRAAWLATRAAAQATPSEKDELFAWYLATQDAAYRDLSRKLDELGREESAIQARGTEAHVMQERPQEPTAFVLYRGEYDKRRDPVKATTPHFLPPLPADLPHNRLGFARWLLRPEHPLTARVTVNRFWQEVFGTGIVRTTGDFGATGEAPSHPELLDWLAVDFRESGWDMKRFFKLLVTSATYRQAALTTPEKLEKDAQDRLLSRGPRFRMDAEMMRDYALAASGLLVRKVGGPSVKPYQPGGVWEAVAIIGSDTRDYKQDRGASLYRRSLYTFWKRSAPPASMEILNAPTRETCTVRRERTDTPLQALVTLNDPQFVEAARHLAERALKEGTVEGRGDYVARRLLARPLRPEEAKVVAGSAADLLAYYKAHPAEAKELVAVGESKADPSLDVPALAAWTMTVNELMNLDEVLNK
jgi:hypothetical protein